MVQRHEARMKRNPFMQEKLILQLPKLDEISYFYNTSRHQIM
jgi:hypothetical protein